MRLPPDKQSESPTTKWSISRGGINYNNRDKSQATSRACDAKCTGSPSRGRVVLDGCKLPRRDPALAERVIRSWRGSGERASRQLVDRNHSLNRESDLVESIQFISCNRSLNQPLCWCRAASSRMFVCLFAARRRDFRNASWLDTHAISDDGTSCHRQLRADNHSDVPAISHFMHGQRLVASL